MLYIKQWSTQVYFILGVSQTVFSQYALYQVPQIVVNSSILYIRGLPNSVQSVCFISWDPQIVVNPSILYIRGLPKSGQSVCFISGFPSDQSLVIWISGIPKIVHVCTMAPTMHFMVSCTHCPTGFPFTFFVACILQLVPDIFTWILKMTPGFKMCLGTPSCKQLTKVYFP